MQSVATIKKEFTATVFFHKQSSSSAQAIVFLRSVMMLRVIAVARTLPPVGGLDVVKDSGLSVLPRACETPF